MINAWPMKIDPGVLAFKRLCLCALTLTYYVNPNSCGLWDTEWDDDVISICSICLICSFVSFTSFPLVSDTENICSFYC